MAVIWIVLAVGAGLWFGRRLGPALVAVVVVMAVPLWLIGGAVVDLLRKVPWRGILSTVGSFRSR